MAKSIRSKAKRAYRAKKRETGVYAAAEAARVHRLNAKLAQIIVPGGDRQVINEPGEENGSAAVCNSSEGHEGAGSMPVDTEKLRISTHGYRNSRHEEWRKSKGLPARPQKGSKGRRIRQVQRRAEGRAKERNQKTKNQV